MTQGTYSRVISKEEAAESFIFVLKDKLAFFPLQGRTFELIQGTSTKRVNVESYHCECRGPEEPHEHYFVRWDHLRAGDSVFIKKDPRKGGRYVLQLLSVTAQQGLCG